MNEKNKEIFEVSSDISEIEEQIVLAENLPETYSTTTTSVTTYSGVYKLRNKGSCLCATVKTDSLTSAEVVVDNDKDSREQWFRITHMGGGQYSIRPLHKTNLALTAMQIQKTTYMVIASDVGTCDTLETLDAASRWTIDSNGTIWNVQYECTVMATATADSCEFGNVFASTNSGLSNQQWVLTKVNNVSSKVLIYNKPTVAYIGKTVSAGIVEVSSESAINQNVTWKSSIPGVAKVNRAGTITPLTVGKTKITATSTAATNLNASYTLTVSEVDSDFDGIDDSNDPNNTSCSESGILVTKYSTSSVSFDLDYREFTYSNMIYSTNIARTSAILSALMYDYKDNRGITRNTTIVQDIEGITLKSISRDIVMLLEYKGMKSVVTYKLEDDYNDDHLSEVTLGYKTVYYNGTSCIVIVVVIRGTNGTIGEWSSNMDIGNTNDSHNEWTNKDNHMGFDITSNRIKKKIDEYVAAYITPQTQLNGYRHAYWVTGHSRGGALANLVAAKLIDESKTVFAYTFAAPATTVSSTAGNSKYQCIFNIVNTDDFVPYFPLSNSGWNFTRYGKTAKISIADTCQSEWKGILGKTEYMKMASPAIPLNELHKIASTRNSCYNYIEGSDGYVFISDSDQYPSNTDGYYNMNGNKKYQSPMFLMKYFAAVAAAAANGGSFYFLNVAPYLEATKKFLLEQVMGRDPNFINAVVYYFSSEDTVRVEHPHIIESYIILLNQIKDGGLFV